MNETPDTVHGRLIESVHISGYSFERANQEFEWLLEEGRWKKIGQGYDDIDKFIATIDFSEFKISIENRKKISKKLADLRATQRAAAKMLGVGVATVNRDTNPVPNETKPEPEPTPILNKSDAVVPLETSPPTIATIWTGDPESYTPEKYIESARLVLGGIDIDPASNEFANKTVMAEKFYTKDADGLSVSWHGNVFLNPPYSHPLVKQFVFKLIDEYTTGNTKRAILLTNNNTDTNWFYKAAKIAGIVCFTKGRINFKKPDGSLSSPTNGQAFFYFGENKKLFRAEFMQYGLIFEVT